MSGARRERDSFEGLYDVLETIARILMWGGLALTLLATSLIVFYIATFSGTTQQIPGDALRFVEMARQGLTVGLIALLVGSAYLFWGEDWLGVVQVVVAALFYFAPLYGPFVLTSRRLHPVVAGSYLALQRAGTGAGVIAIGVLLIGLFVAVRARFSQGVKADQLKYGKGIKEEVDRRNVFLGKCWQLPYCRKFVRERCPIYHARRTCWREKVGCMCEEEVIKGAMENRMIPKDSVAAARYIPKNHKLTLGQKMERCRQCVIYNEHQKHKYRALLPVVLLAFGLGYWMFRTPMLANTRGIFNRTNEIIAQATLNKAGKIEVPPAIQEVLLVCFVFVLLAYSLKALEFMVFKLKV